MNALVSPPVSVTASTCVVGAGSLPSSSTTEAVDVVTVKFPVVCAATVPPTEPGIKRPGISSETLAKAGVVRVDARGAFKLIGFEAPGLAIPYFTAGGQPLIVNGQPFHRVRLDMPQGKAKYLSPAQSGSQLYLPPNVATLIQHGGPLHVVEGEFKALSLVEAGIAAVAVGGITSTCPANADGEPELLPALAELIRGHHVSKVVFVGDNDTAFIPAFASEMVKLAGLLPVPLELLRIPVDAPGKAPDDIREILMDKFTEVWTAWAANPESVTPDVEPGDLVVRLLKREKASLTKLPAPAQDAVKKRLIKLGVAYANEPLVYGEITACAKDLEISNKVFDSCVKAERQEAKKENEREMIEAVLLNQDGTPTLVFDGKNYWRPELDGCWAMLCREDAKLHFGVLGLSRTVMGKGPSPVDQALYEVQSRHRIDFAGPICARGVGPYTENGKKLLVTQGPLMIDPKAGDCPTILGVLGGLLGFETFDDLENMQMSLFIGWLKHARFAIKNPDRHLPGQVLALVGPRDCGKTLLQSKIITPALGGRVNDPGLWLTGRTTHNADLWGAEHQALSDKSLGNNGSERENLRDELKQLVAAHEYPLHKKFGDAITLRPVWRLSLSANDDPESANSLPALDASFSDKIIYLLCNAPQKPFFDEQDDTARERFDVAIRAELPAFLHMVDNFEIPTMLRKGRFGITEWHHPVIVDLLEESSPLAPLMDVLEKWADCWDVYDVEKEMTSVALLEKLTGEYESAFRGIATKPSHLGHQLSRLVAENKWNTVKVERLNRRVGGREVNRRVTVWKIIKLGYEPEPRPANYDRLPEFKG